MKPITDSHMIDSTEVRGQAIPDSSAVTSKRRKPPAGRCKRPLRIDGRNVPNCYIQAHAFILTGDTNREWEAYLAYKGTVPWQHSIPLSAVVSYLKWRGPSI